MSSTQKYQAKLKQKRSPFVNELKSKSLFSYGDARELWDGDGAFQCVWAWLKHNGIISPESNRMWRVI
jgi:hypothetical protein